MTLQRLKRVAARLRGDRQSAAQRMDALLTSVAEPFRSRLLSMYRNEPQIGSDRSPHQMDASTRITPSQGLWLHDHCVWQKPNATLEIGMAYGFSTMFFLAALTRNGHGHHTAIDPFQELYWHGIGLANTRATVGDGAVRRFRHLPERSDRASTDLAREGAVFDLIYIDGNHRFDDVLVDFYLYAPLCAVGGYVVLDDRWMASIQTVAAFLRANRVDFVEVPSKQENLYVFRKIAEDTRLWSDFHPFSGPA